MVIFRRLNCKQRIHDNALKRFDALDMHIGVSDEKRYHAPVVVEERYATDEEEGGKLTWWVGC